MLITSNTLLCVWSAGYSCESDPIYTSLSQITLTYLVIDLKHKYWYVNIPDFGVTTTPVQLYTPHDLAFAKALSIVITGNTSPLSDSKTVLS